MYGMELLCPGQIEEMVVISCCHIFFVTLTMELHKWLRDNFFGSLAV